MADMGNVVFQWEVGQHGRHGEGISRPRAKARTKFFKLLVTPVGQRQVTVTLPAETKAKAKEYAEARWPGAHIEFAS